MKTGIEGIKGCPSPTNCQATSSLLAAIPCRYSLLSLAIPCINPLQLSLASIPCSYPLQLPQSNCMYWGSRNLLPNCQARFPFSGHSLSPSLFQACSFGLFLPLNVWNHTVMWPRFYQRSILWSSCSFVSFAIWVMWHFCFFCAKVCPVGSTSRLQCAH